MLPSMSWLGGNINFLNAIPSLLHPLDSYTDPLQTIGNSIGRPLSRPISLRDRGGSPQQPRSLQFRGVCIPRDGKCYFGHKTPWTQARYRHREIWLLRLLNRVLDCDLDKWSTVDGHGQCWMLLLNLMSSQSRRRLDKLCLDSLQYIVMELSWLQRLQKQTSFEKQEGRQ